MKEICMSKRITLISFMEQIEINKIENLMSKISEKTCKYHMELMMKKDMK